MKIDGGPYRTEPLSSPEEMLRGMVRSFEREGKIGIRIPEYTKAPFIGTDEEAAEPLKLFVLAITSKGIEPDDIVLYSIGHGVLKFIKAQVIEPPEIHYIFGSTKDTPKPDRVGIVFKNKKARFTYGW